jgi:hypothetical protein
MKKNGLTTEEDLFASSMMRMLAEEKFICETQTLNDGNKLLIDGMEQFKRKYEGYQNTLRTSREELTLSGMYDLIRAVNEIPMLETQLNAIINYQQALVEKK